ncbi:hypothetical protein GCM10023078_19790 [Gibbsiella greigii]
MPKQKITKSDVNYVIKIEKTSTLRQSEEVSREAVSFLSENILSEGIWKTVIPAEWNTGWVMDGNHRLSVARYLGLTYLPVVRLHYDDPRVRVLRWDNCEPYPMHQLRCEIQSSILLPFKTTKHLFNPLLPDIRMVLDELRGH